MAPGKSTKVSGFRPAARRERIAPGHAVVARVAGAAIALFDVDGRIVAIDGLCACCGASLADGQQEGGHVACGGCGWRYDLATGSVVGLPALRLDRFAVRIEGGEVLVAMKAEGDP